MKKNIDLKNVNIQRNFEQFRQSSRNISRLVFNGKKDDPWIIYLKTWISRWYWYRGILRWSRKKYDWNFNCKRSNSWKRCNKRKILDKWIKFNLRSICRFIREVSWIIFPEQFIKYIIVLWRVWLNAWRIDYWIENSKLIISKKSPDAWGNSHQIKRL